MITERKLEILLDAMKNPETVEETCVFIRALKAVGLTLNLHYSANKHARVLTIWSEYEILKEVHEEPATEFMFDRLDEAIRLNGWHWGDFSCCEWQECHRLER